MSLINVAQQVPGYVQAQYPAFVDFLQGYYDWLHNEYITQPIETIVDLEQTPEEYVTYFKKQLASTIPEEVDCCRRLLYSRIKDLYTAKGTEEAFRLLFRVLYDTEILILYPSEQILRASDGRWVQENFIAIETYDGALPTDLNFRLRAYSFGAAYDISPSKVVSVDGDVYRIYFSYLYAINLNEGDRVEAFNDADDLIFIGNIIKSPETVNILQPGKGWKIGQVVRLNASVSPSIARVTNIGSEGELIGLEVLEYGYRHVPGQIYYVSPYRQPLLSSTVEINSTITNISPLTYTHTISINDSIKGVTERVDGYSTQAGLPDSYFLEDYTEFDYNANLIFEYQDVIVDNPFEEVSDVIYEEWYESQTALIFNYETIIKTIGHWQDDSGKISNQYIRLQDNFFYQAFSYVIDADISIDQSKFPLKLVNPAGMKPFFNENKTNVLDITIDYEIARTISNERIFLSDVATVTENIDQKLINKPLTDSIDATDAIDQKMVITNLSDTADAIDFSIEKIVELDKYDITDADDSIDQRIITTVVTDSIEVIDAISERNIDKPLTDSIDATDAIDQKMVITNLSDTASAEDIQGEYGIDYFEEDYIDPNNVVHIE